MYCTSRRATAVDAALSLATLTAQAIKRIVEYFHYPAAHSIDKIYEIIFHCIVPLAVLVVNMVVVREVRRACNSAADLGRQQRERERNLLTT